MKILAPPVVEAPGKIMMKFVPIASIVAWIEREAPSPIAIIAITQATPITMPSIVRNERSLLRAIALRPTVVMLQRRRTGAFIVTLRQ